MKLFLPFIFLIFCAFSPKMPGGLKVELITSPTFEKLSLYVFSEDILLNDCQFKITDAKGAEVKRIKLRALSKEIQTIINIEGLEIGEYSFSIIKNKKQLFKGKFIKDWFDADFY